MVATAWHTTSKGVVPCIAWGNARTHLNVPVN